MRIVFTPLLAGKPWNGRTLTTEPLGGSESAVGYLARALVVRGHECLVYTHHSEEGEFDGVVYRNQGRLPEIQTMQADIHISSRWPEIMAGMANVQQRILWIHDLGGMIINGQKNVFLSQDHKAALGMEGDEKNGARFFIIGNGINLQDFLGYKPLIERERNKMLWTSNPDRGLHVAARILQKLRRKWSELTLHIYGRAAVYGWGADAEFPHYPANSDMEGIVFHEPLPKKELAAELKTAWAWFYPSTWRETYAISALEAQAAGTPCICPPFGALRETVQGGILTYNVEDAIDQLMYEDEWERLSLLGRQHAAGCSWDRRAEEWEAMFNA